ncbi:hypothetical protein ACWDSD_24830 [Streptomyces spiralis]
MVQISAYDDAQCYTYSYTYTALPSGAVNGTHLKDCPSQSSSSQS